MKTIFKLSFLLLVVSLLSCRSSKELIYLNDVAANDTIKGLPTQVTEHILQTGDILYVSIKSMNPEVNLLYNPESNMEGNTLTSQSYMKYTSPSGAYLYGYEVGDDGCVKLPMLGKIKVAGISQSDVEAVIQKKADEYLKDAIVKVKLLNFKISVIGEVARPGDYYSYNNSLNVIQAIAMANGNTNYASINNVMVVRPLAKGNKTYSLDLSSKNVYLSEGFYLHPNDYIIVQPDKFKNFQLNAQGYALLISSLTLLVTVMNLFKVI